MGHMMTKRGIFLGFAALLMSAGTAMAAPQMPALKADQVDSPRYVQMVQKQISPSQAKAIARSRVKGGEVVDISRSGNTYRVRVIARDGRVVDIYIDATTGRVKR